MIIKVTSRSFSMHPRLVDELKSAFPEPGLNLDHDLNDKAALIAYVRDADGLIVGLEEIDDAVLDACPNLKAIGKYGVGLDRFDVNACKRRGIDVGIASGVNKRSVAEMDLAFMLSLSRNLYPSSIALKTGTWRKHGGYQLTGKTVGVIGLGNTGSEIIRLLKPFECVVLGNDIVDKSAFCAKHNVALASKEDIFRSCDIVTIHTPLTPLTQHMIDESTLSSMKPTAFLINTARGPIVNQVHLKKALRDGIISGAALDVFEEEPPTDTEFLKMPNLFCTPHIGGNADEAVIAAGMSAINHLKRHFNR